MDSFYMPVKLFKGQGIVRENPYQLIQGRNALIVTGERSALKSGALDDVINILNENNIEYSIFDKIENNPSIENVYQGGIFAKKTQADFIIAIGGGSPLDGAKAISVYAANDIDMEDIFVGQYKNRPLPIVAIPTTAGTGSEVTPYSILTLHKERTKRSFSHPDVFPIVAFLDPDYTSSMPLKVARDTAVDALSHSIEGYISKRSSIFTDYIALEGMRLFSLCIEGLVEGKLDTKTRENLLLASSLGGIVISGIGTTIVHSMGYQLTYMGGLSHGHANGVLLAEFLRFNYHVEKEKIDKMLCNMVIKDIDEFDNIVEKLTPKTLKLSQSEIKKYVDVSIKAKNIFTNPRKVTYNDEIDILTKCCK